MPLLSCNKQKFMLQTERDTHPSYAHTPVIKLILCSAEETLEEHRKHIYV